MNFDQIIQARRSIRQYKKEKPDRSFIDRMLECARLAPSPSHSEPVRYLLIESESRRDALRTEMTLGKDRFLAENDDRGGSKKTRNLIRAYYRFSEFMFNAPYLFALGTIPVNTLSDRLRDAGRTIPNNKSHQDLDISTGLSLSAFMLKGAELGIATCVLTAPLVYIRNVSDILDADLRITCFVTAGYADENTRPLERIRLEELCRTI